MLELQEGLVDSLISAPAPASENPTAVPVAAVSSHPGVSY